METVKRNLTYNDMNMRQWNTTLLWSDRREGGNKRCFCTSVRQSVCPSVCRSVTYIANNSRTQKPSVPKFGRKVTHLRCDSHTIFKVKRSKVRVTMLIHADTSWSRSNICYFGHSNPFLIDWLIDIVHHIFRMARPTNFKLGTRMEDYDPHQPQAPWPIRSKIKVTRYPMTRAALRLSCGWPNGP